MKKMCYAEEDYSFLLFLFTIFINIFCIFYVVSELSTSKQDLFSYIGILCILFIIDIFYCITLYKKTIKNRIKYAKIKKEGTKYQGIITSFNYDSYTNIYVDTTTKEYFAYTLNISYGDNSIFKTPIVAFNPINDLGSKECDIYVYNSQVYATGFKKRKVGENIIWDENDESVRKATRRKKLYFEQNKEGIIVAGVFICAVVGIVIYQIISNFFIK